MIETRGEALDNKEKKRQSIIEAGIVTFIMAFYIVYGIIYAPLFVLLIPVPFIVLGVRNGFIANIFPITLAFFIVEIFLGNKIGLSLGAIFIPLSIGINYSIKKRKNSKQTIFISTLSFLVPLIVLLILEMKVGDVNLISELDQWFTSFVALQTEALQEMGFTNHMIVQTLNEIEAGYNQLIMLIPSLISIFGVFITFINYFFTGIILRGMGYGLIKSPRLSQFELPKDIILGVGAMLLTAYLLNRFQFQYSQALLANITFLISIVFLIQGLAIIDYFLKKRKTKLIFRVIIIVLNVIFVPIWTIIIMLGLVDSVFDLRKLRRPKS